MGRTAAVKSSLTLHWALGQLSRQLGGAGSCEGFEAVGKAKPRLLQEPARSDGSLPGCMVSGGGRGGAGEPKERGPTAAARFHTAGRRVSRPSLGAWGPVAAGAAAAGAFWRCRQRPPDTQPLPQLLLLCLAGDGNATRCCGAHRHCCAAALLPQVLQVAAGARPHPARPHLTPCPRRRQRAPTAAHTVQRNPAARSSSRTRRRRTAPSVCTGPRRWSSTASGRTRRCTRSAPRTSRASKRSRPASRSSKRCVALKWVLPGRFRLPCCSAQRAAAVGQASHGGTACILVRAGAGVDMRPAVPRGCCPYTAAMPAPANANSALIRTSTGTSLPQAAQLEGLMRRPRAMLAALQLDGGGGTPLQAHQPAVKKRSRMAAFGQ